MVLFLECKSGTRVRGGKFRDFSGVSGLEPQVQGFEA